MVNNAMRRQRNMLILLILTLVLLVQPISSVHAGSWVFGSASAAGGSRNYKLWVPSSYSNTTATPLVMVLHGCSQTPDTIAAGTQFNDLADTEGFLVVYPAQSWFANFNRCWNWFEPIHQRRGSGEPAILAAVVDDIRSSYNIDSRRVYVVGLSAGGAMAVIMGATYPDMFSAVGVAAGLEYQAGTSTLSGVLAMSQGGPDPNRQGLAAYQAMGSANRPVRVSVFHGTSDFVVYPINGEQVVTQWAQTNDYVDDGSDNDSVDDTADTTTQGQVPGGRNYIKYTYNDASGTVLLEKWTVNGMGHAWSGGSTAGSYTDPAGPDATREFWRFFSGR
ncbi:MAG: PHB depolymerase family esterase [Chloroflexi bacterium AL-W]|nr:PHB depolymerase family esterase [Chloroflexi bacterium AL-N1]NOK66326.1 PHB depolymerase family esterase [Chloroflexi bacterium AL-N10]NOK71714.1 PHB depolymerase family esterase [Chloroflexi bacterium AL-N5]NOK80971.1 PHB depolymerase family esterase [Chloroflexi bacterium AL-W]NOK89244.1 PHB depolymerase family esterase [Chloroflexi bacterium AL-N15]